MKEDLILIGGGGHCKSCIDVIEAQGKYRIAGILDLRERIGENVLGYNIIGTDEDIADLAKKYEYFFISIGQIKSPLKRKALFEVLDAYKVRMPLIISPSAYVSRHAHVCEGTIIMHNAAVNVNATIGKNCIINTSSVIEHDVTIGDNCHISTGAVINGGVTVEDNCFIGSNVTIKELIHIGRDSVIGAGAIIRKNVAERAFIKKENDE